MGKEQEAQERATIALEHSTGRDVQYGGSVGFGVDQGLHQGSIPCGRPGETVYGRYAGAVQLSPHAPRPACPQPQGCDTSNRNVPLQVALPYDLALEPATGALSLSLYPVSRSRIRIPGCAPGDGSGTAEFKKIVEHPGVVANEPIGVLAHLGLGRAYAIQGEVAKSRAAYADFFVKWKNADRGIPRLAEAKVEYSSLPKPKRAAPLLTLKTPLEERRHFWTD